jgi:hypothetical protein
VVLRQGSDEARLESREDRWVATTPFEGWARRSTLEALFDALVDACVTRFVGEGTRVGPVSPWVRSAARRGGVHTGRTRVPSSSSARRVRPRRRRHPGPERTGADAARVDEQAVVCVPRASLDNLFGAMATLRETRPIAASEEGRASYASFGGSDMIRGAAREGTGIVQGTSSDPRTSRPSRAGPCARRRPRASSPRAENWQRRLDTPRARIRAHRAISFVESIDVGSLDTVGVCPPRRQPVIARYVGDAVELLAPSALRFRSRELVGARPTMSLVRGGRQAASSDSPPERAWRIESRRARSGSRPRAIWCMLVTLRDALGRKARPGARSGDAADPRAAELRDHCIGTST